MHSGTVTRAGLEQTLKRVREHPELLQTSISRSAINRELQAAFEKVKRVQQVQLKDAEAWDWEFCDPCKLIGLMVSECDILRNVFAQAALIHPIPWHIIVAFDEFDVGDTTNHEHSRKLMCLSCSFLEFGKERLWSEDYWFTPVLVRNDMIKEAVGGWSAMLRLFLNLLLKGPTGISTAGLPLQLGVNVFLLRANLSHLLADGAGHEIALEWSGASSIKPCFKHWNVLKIGTDVASRDPSFVELDCADPNRFRRAVTDDLHDIADALFAMRARYDAGIVRKGRMKQFQKACGFGCSPSGLLADRQLGIDLINASTIDWMHTFLQDGALTVEAALLVQACRVKLGLTLDVLRNFFKQPWLFPRQHQSKGVRLWRVFQDRRVCDRKIKASASEMLQLYGLLRHFFEFHVWDLAEIRACLLYTSPSPRD